MPRTNGIFCLEGEWEPRLHTRYTVEHVLRLVGEADYAPVDYIHRDVGTAEGIAHYLRKWAQREYRDYPILYLAMHGHRSRDRIEGGTELKPGDARRRGVDFLRLGEEFKGRLRRRVIYVSACEGLNVSALKLNRFLRLTGARAILGYTKSPDWEYGTIIDYLILNTLARRRLGLALNKIQAWRYRRRPGPKRRGRTRARELDLRQYLRDFGFRMIRRQGD